MRAAARSSSTLDGMVVFASDDPDVPLCVAAPYTLLCDPYERSLPDKVARPGAVVQQRPSSLLM